jgi:hypothetical protein
MFVTELQNSDMSPDLRLHKRLTIADKPSHNSRSACKIHIGAGIFYWLHCTKFLKRYPAT